MLDTLVPFASITSTGADRRPCTRYSVDTFASAQKVLSMLLTEVVLTEGKDHWKQSSLIDTGVR